MKRYLVKGYARDANHAHTEAASRVYTSHADGHDCLIRCVRTALKAGVKEILVIEVSDAPNKRKDTKDAVASSGSGEHSTLLN